MNIRPTVFGPWGWSSEACYERALTLQSIFRLRQFIQWPPHQAINGDHHERHDNRRRQQDREVALIARLADLRAQTLRDQCLVLQLKILGDDGGIPRSA